MRDTYSNIRRMTRPILAILFGCLVIPPVAHAQDSSRLDGRWTLNRGQSQFPKEIGFTADWLSDAIAAGEQANAGAAGGAARSGGRGGGRNGGGAAGRGPVSNRQPPRESVDDAERVELLTDEVRMPPLQLTIADTPTAVTITADNKPPRVFHTNGRIEALDLSARVTTELMAARDARGLVVTYRVEQGRQLRYSYSRIASPEQLLVDIEFVEAKGGEKLRLVYDRPGATDTASAAPAPVPSSAGQSGAGAPAAAINQRPDAALMGLRQLGVVIEDLSAQAAACGLKQDALQAMVTARLTDAGLKVLRYSDEETYLYVNVVTTSASNGLCVSRYDVDVYANTPARLSYGKDPVLLQAQLLHKGGLTGSAAAAHGDSVMKGVLAYVDEFVSRIRNANK